MQTLRAAADLLAAGDSLERLAAIAASCGLDGLSSPLDAETRHVLGLGDQIEDAHIVSGEGALRGLLVLLPSDVDARHLLPRIAARLAARAPHCLWLVVAAQPARAKLAIMAWTDDRRPPRIAALLVDPSRVVDSDAETLRALAAAGRDRDVLTHARWVEILGREALSARFYRALERALSSLAASSDHATIETRREIALLNCSRLLFVSFLEAKGWLDRNPAFIAQQFDACMLTRGRFHNRVLRPLFFGTLNTPTNRRAPIARAFGNIPFLNGGLFARTPLERRQRAIEFSDDAYGELLASVFAQYRFTAREETATWNEAAIDPEMLGRAFESLMGTIERRRTGAFYTPFALVERVADAGLELTIGEHASRGELERITILDPACGSGAFLVHVLERLASLRTQRGDPRDLSAIRREVLTRSIFGVDVNPTAVWLCELRLWLSVVIESDESDPSAVLPLPNLDRNIRVGDALSGQAFGPNDLRLSGGAALRRLRQRYANASGVRKDSLGRQLDRAERERALQAVEAELETVAERRRDLLVARRGRDLFGERYRPSRDERVASDDLRKR
ncbi:MAG TPA: N-6 DNA methylase, partial [Gemmatimonadaceae bacterium]